MSQDCIFCKIVNGDFNTEFVYENEHVVVFKDINPKAPIHLLVVPRVHVASLNELEDKNLMGELLMAVKETTKKIGLKSYKTLINTGKEAGQEVFHLHIHILGEYVKPNFSTTLRLLCYNHIAYLNKGEKMKNGIENGYYHEITPSGFGIAIKAGKVLFSKQSDFQKVEVFETDSALGRVLTLDDLMMTTEGDEYHYHEMISHIPMMQHKNPKTVLVIGGGDGGTVREVLKHKTVEKVVLCEIDGMVIDACKEFLPTISCGLSDPRVEIKVEDAIEFIKDKKDEYDIILIDSTDPMGPGEGLFTEEFYTNVKNSLKDGGIMVAQSESPFVNKLEIKKMYDLLKKVFPVCSTYTSNIPTYPGGYWAWAFCSKDVKPLTYFAEDRYEDIVKTCKIYNKDYHNARFALPNYLKELL